MSDASDQIAFGLDGCTDSKKPATLLTQNSDELWTGRVKTNLTYCRCPCTSQPPDTFYRIGMTMTARHLLKPSQLGRLKLFRRHAKICIIIQTDVTGIYP